MKLLDRLTVQILFGTWIYESLSCPVIYNVVSEIKASVKYRAFCEQFSEGFEGRTQGLDQQEKVC